MRVLIDYRSALRQRSGAGEYTHQLVRALLAAFPRGALDLTLFSSSWKDRLRPDPDLAGAALVDRRVPVSVLNLLWHRAEWPKAELLTGHSFDVVHSMHPLLLPSRRAAQVVTIHDINFLTHPDRTRAEVRRDYPVLAPAHARRADAVIVPSRFTAELVERQLGVDAARIHLCAPGAPDWPPRNAAPASGYVLFVGTLEPRKNLGALLDAYERLTARGPVPQLVIAGRPTEQSRGWLDRIARPPLDAVVRHIGYVDSAKRRELYAGARLLVVPSLEEGFGLPVLEAMTLGVPVVAANRGSLPEVAGDAARLVDPDDPKALAVAIDALLHDDAASAASAKGLRRAREFRWDETARRMYAAYEQAIEHRKCASA